MGNLDQSRIKGFAILQAHISFRKRWAKQRNAVPEDDVSSVVHNVLHPHSLLREMRAKAAMPLAPIVSKIDMIEKKPEEHALRQSEIFFTGARLGHRISHREYPYKGSIGCDLNNVLNGIMMS